MLGFVALAALKRLGFALLWGLLVWWWIVMIGNGPLVFLDMPFLAWTAFAAPLYVLSAVGLSTETAGSRRWQFEVVLTLLIWTTIAVLAFFFGQRGGEVLRIRDTPFQYTGTVRGYLYAAWPFVIGTRELGRVLVALWRSRKTRARHSALAVDLRQAAPVPRGGGRGGGERAAARAATLRGLLGKARSRRICS